MDNNIKVKELIKLGIDVSVIGEKKGSTQCHYQFHYFARCPWGGDTIQFTEQELPGVLSNKHNIDGYLLGLTLEEHEEWIENEGQIRCSALTKKGKRCRSFVKGTFQSSAREFKMLQGSFCPVHSIYHDVQLAN